MLDSTCPRCNTPTRGRPFCGTCGAQLAAADSRAALPITPYLDQATEPSPPPGRRRSLLAVVAVLTVLTVGAAATITATQLGGDDGDSTAVPSAGESPFDSARSPSPSTSSSFTAAGSGNYVEIAVGSYFACGLTEVGTVQCWGNSDNGQLGDGRADDSDIDGSPIPVNVIGLPGPASKVWAESSTACAKMTSGGIWCWGSGLFGPNGNSLLSLVPVDTSAWLGKAAEISIGFRFSCAVTESGGARCWGNNDDGQLGDGSTETPSGPVTVTGLDSGVQSISVVGEASTCALLSEGSVKCWGSNEYGALGVAIDSSTVPVTVSALTTSVEQIEGSGSTVCARQDDGYISCWGMNPHGQVGNGETSQMPVRSPTLVRGITDAAALSGGSGHNCALTGTGEALCWGLNGFGQLGTGTTNAESAPTPVRGLSASVTALSAGDAITCVVTTDRSSWCFGHNDSGGLGNGGFSAYSNLPTRVRMADESEVPTATPTEIAPSRTSIREIDWRNHSMPAEVCDREGSVQVEDGLATGIPSSVHGTVELRVDSSEGGYIQPAYGDLTDDGVEDAVIFASCTTGGGTASSRIDTYAVIFDGTDPEEAVTAFPLPKNDDATPSLPTTVSVGRGSLTISYSKYAVEDATCCPSVAAETTWSWANGDVIEEETTQAPLTE